MKIWAARRMLSVLESFSRNWVFWLEYLLIVSLFAIAALMITSLRDHTLEDHFRYLPKGNQP